MTTKPLRAVIVLLLGLALLLAACGSDDDADTTADTSEDSDTAATDDGDDDVATDDEDATADDDSAATAEGTELERAFGGEFDGSEVTILGVWTEAEEEKFVGTLASFSEDTGIEIVYQGSTEFETLINVQVESGDAPDVAMFPQPGLLQSFVESGDALDLGPFIDPAVLAENYAQTWIDLGTFDGQLSGVFFRASTKSIVWYPVEAWDSAGYAIPETWTELTTLQDQMVSDGAAPWCISIENSDATGWVATDWLEDILLRTAPPEIYDQWVAHEIPFNHPEVLEAAEIMSDVWFTDGIVFGGRTGILSTFIGDTPTPMFSEGGPDCWMHRQAGWIIDFFPEDKQEFGVDTNYFYLPPIEEEFGRPVLGGGDQAGAFNDRPEVRALMQYLATPESAAGWIEAGGFISPNQGVTLDQYASEADRTQAEILLNATTLRFDASDLMPAEVGVGTFWSGMVDWVEGDDTESVFASIEESWPAS